MEKVYSVTWYNKDKSVQIQLMYSEYERAKKMAKRLFETFQTVWQSVTTFTTSNNGHSYEYWISDGSIIVVQEHEIDPQILGS